MRSGLPGFRDPTGRAVTLVLSLLLLSGCYTYHVYQVGGPEGRELGNQPSTEWESKTLHGFLFGAVRQDLPVENCRMAGSHGIEEVKVDRGAGHMIASVLTLGLWVPMRFSWRCYRAPVTSDSLE